MNSGVGIPRSSFDAWVGWRGACDGTAAISRSRAIDLGLAFVAMIASDDRRVDVLIIGGGAAGMMCAIEAGRRGRSVVVFEKAKSPGRKIRISGGGRCNFTNLNARPEHYLSANPRFCISALSRYSPEDFVAWVESAGIAYHHKTLGQLFCDGSAQQIVDLLVDACGEAGVRIICQADVTRANAIDGGFEVAVGDQVWRGQALVVACGGPSVPKMGATRFGYGLANHFGLAVVEPRPGLVPLTFSGSTLKAMSTLSGLSLPVVVRCKKVEFRDDLLFTHRGLSGPVILQISSFWRRGETLQIDLLPGHDSEAVFTRLRQEQPKLSVEKILVRWLPKRLAQWICKELDLSLRISELSNAKLAALVNRLHRWPVIPSGSEGFRTAEVTVGGVDTRALSPTTFEAKTVPRLYFVGEVVDVTGQLGGYNFQWAWASGHACGQVV